MKNTTHTLPKLSPDAFSEISRYDPESDSLYAYCIPPNSITIESQEPYNEQVIADVDSEGRVVGLEILNASKVFDEPRHVTETHFRALIATIVLLDQMDQMAALEENNDEAAD